ncbi:MAG: peptidylprolyl isomerase [Saprospiraceae bacterium]
MRFFLVLFFGLFAMVSNAQEKQIIDKVIGVVGDELVLLSDVEEQHALMAAQNPIMPEDSRCRILDNLLSQNLLVNQAKLDSIVVSDEEVEDQLNARIDRILTLMGNDMNQFEDYYGQTVNEVKDQFRTDLNNQLLSERMRGEIMIGVTVTPKEVKNFFAEIPQDSLPYFNSEVEIGEIVIFPEINSEERQKSIDQLTDIKQQIEAGGDFAELAGKYSDDPGSGRAGGELGWTKRGQFVPEFEAAAYNLDINEMSELVESDFGFHLIELLDRRGNSIKTRHILIRPEITDADLELTKQKLDSVRNLIVNDSLNFSIAVKRYSSDKSQSYNNDGRLRNPATGNTFFEIGDLEPDVYFTIDTMKIGSLSAPFDYTTPQGDDAFRIIQLQSRSDPHQANLAQDYSKIQQAAIESKKAEFVSDWVTRTVDGTYINVDAMYKGCPNLDRWLKEDIRP